MPPLPPRSVIPASAGKQTPFVKENEDAPAFRDADAPASADKPTPVEKENEDAPAFRDADAPILREPAAPVSREEEETRGHDVGGNETANARPPKTWEVRLSQCKALAQNMDRTLACYAASACLQGPSARAGFVYPTQDSVNGEIKGGVVETSPASLESKVEGGVGLKPPPFRYTEAALSEATTIW